ncbi:hypothetical protein FF38_06081 [Lucilia cuprina]|uniref:Uncharacterized protein n=1 Tax=Lucilia cuprina TaxID=7375 RepID=A0A0L0CLR1_LUCCU|nr:hypothetical protein FF38_06081 [Lucilia cuprina]
MYTISNSEIQLEISKIRKHLYTHTFIHMSVGSGIPLGGPHSNNAVSPLATRVSLGWARKSSRKTVNIALLPTTEKFAALNNSLAKYNLTN